MFHWVITFFVLAIIAAVLGFGGLAGSFVEIAKILTFVFLVLVVVSFLAGRNSISGPSDKYLP